MSKSFEVECEINAAPEKVWSILVDTANWPKWDPFCEKIEMSSMTNPALSTRLPFTLAAAACTRIPERATDEAADSFPSGVA